VRHRHVVPPAGQPDDGQVSNGPHGALNELGRGSTSAADQARILPWMLSLCRLIMVPRRNWGGRRELGKVAARGEVCDWCFWTK
jgi:hypothetical protein